MYNYCTRKYKAYRIILWNLHPSIPEVTDIGAAIKEIEYSVRQINNIIHKITKLRFSIFSVGLELAQNNNELFKLLRTKITVYKFI